MPSAKKQRGKQRKASVRARHGGKAAAATARDVDVGRDATLQPREVYGGVCRGELYATEVVAYDLCRDLCDATKRTLLHSLVERQLVDIVLTFLQQCNYKKLGDVTHSANLAYERAAGGRYGSRSREEPVDDPSLYIILLINISGGECLTGGIVDDIRVEIANGVGPLIGCMCSASKQFFKSTEHWHGAVEPSICLLDNITRTDEANIALSKQEGYVDFLVQAYFWETHRPDIVQESRAIWQKYCFETIASLVINLIERVIDVYTPPSSSAIDLDKRAARGIHRIAMTSIVNKTHSKGSDVPFVMGLVNHLRSKVHELPERYFSVMQKLIFAGSVDKGVISGMIQSVSTLDYRGIANVSCLLCDILTPAMGDEASPHDNRYAYAIDQEGLLEVCLELLVRYKDNSHPNADLLHSHMEKILAGGRAVTTMPKTSRAMLRKRCQILEAIQRAEPNIEKSSTDKCKQLLRMVKMMVHLTVDTCCSFCKKTLTEEEVKKCSRCKEVYCSRACQERGHEKICISSLTVHGSATRKAAKREELIRRNVDAIIPKLVDENQTNLLFQATLLGHTILDCIIEIDLMGRPGPAISVKLAADYLESFGAPHDPSILRECFDRNRSQGHITSMTWHLSTQSDARGNVKTLTTLKTHRHKSWEDAQANVIMNVFGTINLDPKTREDTFGVFFCDWFDRKWKKEEVREELLEQLREAMLEKGYEKKFEEEMQRKDKKMAEILGVEPGVDERTVKVACRRLMLKYHPDKWRSDSEHGMAKEEALEHFQSIQSAYDHLLSRFDNDDGDDYDALD